ncbi:MAG: alpha/beta hydrolase [Pseudomonadota bacterium]
MAKTVWDQCRLSFAAEQVEVPVCVIRATSILPREARARCFVSEAPNWPWLTVWREQANAQIIALVGAGHFAMLEQPKEVNQAIRRLIKQI